MRKSRIEDRNVVKRHLESISTRVGGIRPPVSAAVTTGRMVENCVKAALRLRLDNESNWVKTGQLAVALDLPLPTVSHLLKEVSDRGFAVYKPYYGISLTDGGCKVGARFLRRHRLLETFFERVLQLPWDQIHAEAEKIEHTISDLVIDRLDQFLGFPCRDPHGDPIPLETGTIRGDQSTLRPLAECDPDTRITVVRVINQEPSFLRYLSSLGLGINLNGTIESHDSEGGTIGLSIDGKRLVLSELAAAQLLVQNCSG